ncbi:MAG: ChaN family lipoprotein [Pseudomonadota bacterium]
MVALIPCHNFGSRLGILLVLAFLAALSAVPVRAFDLPDWSVPDLADHPLVGTVWTGSGNGANLSEMAKAAESARHVLVGEIHPNADHHTIQAAIIAALVQADRRPTIVFEMIPNRLDGALQAFVKSGSKDSDALGEAVDWSKRGWPDWSIYRPIGDVALEHGLPMRAGNIDRSLMREIGRKGLAALAASQTSRFGLDNRLPPQDETALRKVLYEGHCRVIPEAALGPMVLVQRTRDGSLADAMLRADNPDGTVLIAGAGHVRKDWAVPAVLASRAPQETVLSIALIEVEDGRNKFADYTFGADGPAPFDFVLFTPRSETGDRCAGLKERFDRKKSSTTGN